MRFFGHTKTPAHPVLPDTVLAVQLTASTVQAFDYPTGADFIRISVGSSVAGQGVAYFNPSSTSVALPTTAGTATTASSGLNIPITAGEGRMYQVPGASTGFSLIAPTSVQACVEFWSRAGV
jgi:hypothetical protein